ncbi:MAG TPA: gas vesicle protein GvpJ [Vicinamibacterales bacterium]|jgi:hypothetical protein|nr:gas vesicle protein GvpJ [Vicinamibacterales bacterium]
MSPDRRRPARRQAPGAAQRILGPEDATLLDIVDNVLSKGVMLTGDVSIGLANVDLVYARVSLLLCAADLVLPGESHDLIVRHAERLEARRRARRRRA